MVVCFLKFPSFLEKSRLEGKENMTDSAPSNAGPPSSPPTNSNLPSDAPVPPATSPAPQPPQDAAVQQQTLDVPETAGDGRSPTTLGHRASISTATPPPEQIDTEPREPVDLSLGMAHALQEHSLEQEDVHSPTIVSPVQGLHDADACTFPKMSIPGFLCSVPHFCTLTYKELLGLHLLKREYDALDVVLEAGSSIQHVYVLQSGTVEVFEYRKVLGPKRVGTMKSPAVFGVEGAVFGESSQFVMRAGENNTTILLIPKQQFVDLLHSSHVFKQSIATRLIDSVDVFR